MRLFTITFCLLSVVLTGRPAQAEWRDTIFSPEQLTHAEIVYLQAAAALFGDYNGLLDGKWGRRSQSALHKATDSNVVRWRNLTGLIDRTDHAFSRDGWDVLNFEHSGTSHWAPMEIVNLEKHPDHTTLVTLDRSLPLRVMFEYPQKTYEQHLWLQSAHVGTEPFYHRSKPDLMISSGRISSGKNVYLRSERRGEIYATTLIQNTSGQQGRANLIAASFKLRHQSMPVLPMDGVLAALRSSAKPTPPAHPEPGARAAGAPSGTGFYVNATDIMTADHVVDGCAWVSLADGTALTILARDPDLDLAVLTSSRRAQTWLTMGTTRKPRLGQNVFALGFPFLGMFDQGLAVTGGNVSALPSTSGKRARMMVSAPVQPGNSGGPLIGANGTVLGVIVSRADDIAVLVHQGALPQNMNFAVPPDQVTGFLATHGIFFGQSDVTGLDLSDGVPSSVQDAVKVVQCHQ
ncbi:S1C family serine protease [Pseudaestuariivita sp.]|uniref:S1C family serine protease n=1 Tax=Pseudaestuariivita sp. TaxID=2211669 RepID=UPI00405A3FC5